MQVGVPGGVLVFGGGGGSQNPPFGPGRPAGLPGSGTLRNAASGPIRARFRSFPRNLVKTGKCHQKTTKRPVIVPILKTGLRSQLLIF